MTAQVCPCCSIQSISICHFPHLPIHFSQIDLLIIPSHGPPSPVDARLFLELNRRRPRIALTSVREELPAFRLSSFAPGGLETIQLGTQLNRVPRVKSRYKTIPASGDALQVSKKGDASLTNIPRLGKHLVKDKPK